MRNTDNSISLASQIDTEDGKESEVGSLADYLNSSRFSAVNHDRDTYAEDIVIQKIIYYISFFKDDVRTALFEKRSKDQLA